MREPAAPRPAAPALLEGLRRRWSGAHGESAFGTRLLLTAGTNGVLALLAVATGTLAARLLGPTGRGELAAIQIWANSLTVVALLGLPDSLVYFSARQPRRASSLLTSAILLALAASVPLVALGVLAMPLLLSAQDGAIVDMARWYLLLLPLQAIVGMALHPLRGRNQLGVWNALRLTPTVGWLGVLIAVWIIGSVSAELVAGGYLVVLLLVSGPLLVIVHRRLGGSLRPQPRLWRPLLRFGLPNFLAAVPKVLTMRLDQMLMAALVPPQMLGLYVVAVAWSGAVNPMLHAVGSVFFPHIASSETAGARETTFARISRLTLLLALVLAAVLGLATPFAVPLLFGADFAAAVPVALVLLVAEGIVGFNHVLEEGLRGLGRPRSIVAAEFAGLAVTVVALPLLLRELGILGAALASVLSYLVVAAVLIGWARALTGQPLRALLLPRRPDLRDMWTKARALVTAAARGGGPTGPTPR